MIRALGIALAGSALIAPAPAADIRALDLSQFCPFFMEDFRNLRIAPRSLEQADWIAHTPWNGDFGDAAFSDPGPEGPFSVDKGELKITARKGKDGRWHSGLIAAGDAQGRGHGVRYGYFEARMQLPKGPGTWPAFWLQTLHKVDDGTASVELDAIEYYGHNPKAFQTGLLVWHGNKPMGGNKAIPVPEGALEQGFHTYGIAVLPETVTYYLDRRPVWQQPTPPELTRPMFPLVNLALGSGYPIDHTPDPSLLRVSYVHVYALRAGAGGSGGCQDKRKG
ncbi:glycoside hydrolase family 16 protein [Novosphingobium rosa]|uniref:glycoside hydrolase family 16 protein n=1 Tax=Novosphingobium rosa TaxID=76978 RepID=UPI00082F8AAE|nr:glycoside hydrolase family 16 protein [Novosphingobium rosa]